MDVVTLPLHGGAYLDDLAGQAFARHLAAGSPDEASGRRLIAGMRAFLENRPDLLPDPPWDTADAPSDGAEAIARLAAAAGHPPGEIAAARTAARHDLAASAWVLDPADGLDELRRLLAGRAALVLIADPADPATGPVLDALELTDLPVAADPAGRPAAGREPASTLVIDTAWSDVLKTAHRAGRTTAVLDRFGRRQGTPDLRAPTLAGLLPGIADWLTERTDRWTDC